MVICTPSKTNQRKLFIKALSIRQPYAELILSGKKTIESRLWKTKFRGEFLIYAGLNVSSGACKRFGFDPEKLVKGFIVGKAVLVDVKEYPIDKYYLKDSDKHFGSKEGLQEFGWVGKKKYGFMSWPRILRGLIEPTEQRRPADELAS